MIRSLIAALLLFSPLKSETLKPMSFESPDGQVVATLALEKNRLIYHVDFKDQTVVEPSRLGISVDGMDLGSGVTIGQSKASQSDETYETRGNHTTARNHFINYSTPIHHQASGREFRIEFRVYDDGVAFRYIVPGEGTQHVDGESTSWKIMEGSKAWYFERLTKKWKLKSYAGVWMSTDIEKLHKATPEKIGRVQGTPIVLKLPKGLGYAAVTKAATYNYSGMRLDPVGDRVLTADFTEGEAGFRIEGDIVTPWRVTMLADDLNELVNSDLINNLNPPPDPTLFPDVSYIKPGRSAWSWESLGLGTPDDQKRYIDWAAEMEFEYSTVDDGWKEWDQPWETIKTLSQHGAGIDVGVFVWVDSKDIRDPSNNYQQMRDYFDKVAAAGAVGLKIDFMNSESKEMVDFEIAVLRNAAKRRLMINFHGCHASTGEERTYPNEVTREGIRGIEVNKHKDGPLPASHNAALPFTRFIVGQADYTPVLYTNPGPTTFAHQLATLIPYTTALQTIAEYPPTLMNASPVKEAFPIMKAIPSVWDETKVLPGSEIGDLAVIARRSDEAWFVGILNGAGERVYNLDLSFLGDADHSAKLLSDDLEAEPVNVIQLGRNDKAEGHRKQWRTALPFKIENREVTGDSKIRIKLAEGGGFVGWFLKN